MKCKKKKFKDEIAAKFALSQIAKAKSISDKKPIRAYHCLNCGRWHLTSATTKEFQEKILPQIRKRQKLRDEKFAERESEYYENKLK